MAAKDSLFGCPGGIIFRPHATTVHCGGPGDIGGYCHEPCPSLAADASRTGPSSVPSSCTWDVADIGIYLERETHERRAGVHRNNGYNEFLIRGDLWASNMPRTIEAFLTTTPGGTMAHTEFMVKYGLSKEEVPLLLLGSDPNTPFEELTTLSACKGWCNQWTCDADDCGGCKSCR